MASVICLCKEGRKSSQLSSCRHHTTKRVYRSMKGHEERKSQKLCKTTDAAIYRSIIEEWQSLAKRRTTKSSPLRYQREAMSNTSPLKPFVKWAYFPYNWYLTRLLNTANNSGTRRIVSDSIVRGQSWCIFTGSGKWNKAVGFFRTDRVHSVTDPLLVFFVANARTLPATALIRRATVRAEKTIRNHLLNRTSSIASESTNFRINFSQ